MSATIGHPRELDICITLYTYAALEIINIIISSICIAITIIIIIHACIHLPQQKKIHIIFKLLFWLSIAMGLVTYICHIAMTIFCTKTWQQSAVIATVFAWSIFYLIITVIEYITHPHQNNIQRFNLRNIVQTTLLFVDFVHNCSTLWSWYNRIILCLCIPSIY